MEIIGITENSIRDLISILLSKKFGKDWVTKCGVTPERISRWEERKVEYNKSLGPGITEERLIYFSDFTDLELIISKNWANTFKDVFDDSKKLSVFLGILSVHRNSIAHNRQLLHYQRMLVIGICEEIRTRIITYRSKMETPDEYFPRIESVADNYGNVVSPDQGKHKATGLVLRPGDKLQFIINATDPLGGKLYYGFHPNDYYNSKSNTLTITIDKSHIATSMQFDITICSERDGHAMGKFDDIASFAYTILPEKIKS